MNKKNFPAISLLCLFAASAVPIHSAYAQASQISPDWTSVDFDFFNLTQATVNPVMTASMVTDRSNVSYVASPFLYRQNATWYMFFEVNLGGVYPNVPSDIGLATSTDGLNWTYGQIVLDEPFHLGNPHVFNYNGTYYMIPETFTENQVRLYKASNFPYNWTFVSALVSGSPFFDATIFQYGSTWWMYTTVGEAMTNLYYSANLTDPSSWYYHPMNPVNSDNSSARSAGRVIVFNGTKIIRLAENNNVSYGYSVRAFQVDTLNTTSYQEHEVSQSPLIQASGIGWNKDGMHHIDPWWTGERWIAAVDGVNYGASNNWSIGIYSTPVVIPEFTSIALLAFMMVLSSVAIIGKLRLKNLKTPLRR